MSWSHKTSPDSVQEEITHEHGYQEVEITRDKLRGSYQNRPGPLYYFSLLSLYLVVMCGENKAQKLLSGRYKV